MKNFFVGVDIGGTSVRIALAEKDMGIIGGVTKFPFIRLKDASSEVEENIIKNILKMIYQNKLEEKHLKGIGVSLAANFNRETGDITIWPNNQSWNGLKFKEQMEKQFCVPVILEDDANSAALGEKYFGVAKGFEDIAYLTVSTGIGSGIILNGDLYVGSNGWAGEIGHTKIYKGKRKCTCGEEGCLQAYVSGPAIVKEVLRKTGINVRNNEVSIFEDVVRLLEEGNEKVMKLLIEAGNCLAEAIFNLVMILDLSLIVLGGGVIASCEIIAETVKRHLDQKLKSYGREVEVRFAGNSDENGVKGILAEVIKKCRKMPEIGGI